jgi:hypothetical protein
MARKASGICAEGDVGGGYQAGDALVGAPLVDFVGARQGGGHGGETNGCHCVGTVNGEGEEAMLGVRDTLVSFGVEE